MESFLADILELNPCDFESFLFLQAFFQRVMNYVLNEVCFES
jgi:hypothetical protein